MAKKKRKGVFSKLIVLFVIAANIVFTTAVMWVFSKTACEPTTLIGAWFAFTTVELWSLASITKQKINKGDEANDL